MKRPCQACCTLLLADSFSSPVVIHTGIGSFRAPFRMPQLKLRQEFTSSNSVLGVQGHHLHLQGQLRGPIMVIQSSPAGCDKRLHPHRSSPVMVLRERRSGFLNRILSNLHIQICSEAEPQASVFNLTAEVVLKDVLEAACFQGRRAKTVLRKHQKTHCR